MARKGSEKLENLEPKDLQLPLGLTLDDVVREYVEVTLQYCGNNRTRAAKMLGLSRKTLYLKLARWQTERAGKASE